MVYFHIFLHIISVFNWVLGNYCHIVKIKKKVKKYKKKSKKVKKKKKTSLFLKISGNPEMWQNQFKWEIKAE